MYLLKRNNIENGKYCENFKLKIKSFMHGNLG